MNTRAQARFRRLLAATLPLLLAPVPALLAQSASVLATPEDVRALLRSAQAAALPARASSSIAEEPTLLCFHTQWVENGKQCFSSERRG